MSLVTALDWQDVAFWLGESPRTLPHLAAPLWLLAGAAPILLVLFGWWRGHRFARYADAALRPWAEIAPPAPMHRRQRWIHLSLILFWLLAVLALADPRVPKSAASESEIRPPVMFLLDTTADQQVADVAPNRLERTQTLLAALVRALPNRRLGLMIARDEAGMILPPSTDRALLDTYLTDWPQLKRPLSPEDAAGALNWVAQMPFMRGGAVVWLTGADAENFNGARGTALLAAAEALHHAGIRLIALTVAGQGGPILERNQPLKSADDTPILSTPAPERVAELAALTDGRAQTTRKIPEDIAFITHAINALPNLPPTHSTDAASLSLRALPLGLSLLALAIALGLTLAPRSRAPMLSALVLCLCLPAGFAPPPAEAATRWVDQHDNAAALAAGQAALKQGDFARAQVLLTPVQGYAARLGTGIAAFRRADYAYAVGQFQQALWQADTHEQSALALYNLGLALTLAGRYPAARDAFAAVSQMQNLPESLTAPATENLRLLETLLQSAAKNSANSPKFQGIQIAKYGYSQDPAHSKMDKDIQKSDGSITGMIGNPNPTATAAPQPFVLDPATESSARAKLNLIRNSPAPLLDSLLRQQPYAQPAFVPDSSQAPDQTMEGGKP